MTNMNASFNPREITILNVDDSAANLYIRNRLLRFADYRVIEAATGRDTLRLTRTHHPQLIVLDAHLPDMDGLEVCRAIKNDPDTKSTMILLVSASRVAIQDRILGLEQGADGYLIEPIESDEFLATIKALLRLYHTEQRLALALKATTDVVWDWDTVTDCLLWSQAGTDRFGWSDVVDHPQPAGWWMERVHPEDQGRVGDRLSASLREPSVAYWSDEYRFRQADGRYAWVMDRASVLRDETGIVMRMVGAMQDVTTTRSALQALRESEAQLRDSTELLERRVEERTAELNQSHERLRALANELNVAEQRERTRLAGELHDYLAQLLVVLRMKLRQTAPLATSGKAKTLLNEADHILTQSLDYTRSLVAELAPPALYDFGLTQALAWLASQMLQHGLHVCVTSQEDVLVIPEEQSMLLFQSVRELLFNVLKHAQVKHATVSVSITPNHELHLLVTDKGCGFDLTRIQQADPKRFGLFSLRERLAAMGGRFELHSTVGQGTHALLVTPYWPAPSVVSGHNGPVANGKPSQSDRERKEEVANHGTGHFPPTPYPVPHIRVLIVDDHAMVRQGLCSVLKEYQDVIVAGEACNGAEALDQVEALRPSVVVMDINMPMMNGIRATAVIKARYPDISVIGLSVQAGGLNEEAMKQAGAVTLLTKEAAVEDLYRTIRETLALDHLRE